MQKVKVNSLRPGQKLFMKTNLYKVSSIGSKGKMVLLNIESVGSHSSKRTDTLVMSPNAYVYIKN